VRLLTKIFGNRDDPETATSGGSEESAPERQTIELEPYELSAGDEPRATSEQSGRVTFAPPASGSTSPENAGAGGSSPNVAAPNVAAPAGAGRSGAEGRRKRRRPPAADGSEEQPHELTRRRIARPTASTVELPPSPPPIPVHAPAADDPEEIDVSDQLDEMTDAEADLDASIDLIIEDDEPSEEDEEEETNTSVSVWGAAATGSGPASSPIAASEPASAEPATAESLAAAPPAADASPAAASPEPESAADGSGSISPNATQPDPEWTRMPTETKRPKQTLVEAGTEFTGTVKSSCPVVVHGTLEGDIDAPTLSIATTGTVHGNIRAESLRSFGTLAGNVDAGEVYVSGVVRSKTVIRARRLELQLGSSEKSQIEVTVKTSVELNALPSSPEVSSSLVSDALGSSALSSNPVSETTSSEGEPSGNAGWDLPEAESGVEPVRARGKRTTAK
jgi:cytoskeletal protein CcmA (bactofilin family)